MPLLFDPGTSWEYGIGIDLAGKVVEAVTGQRLGKSIFGGTSSSRSACTTRAFCCATTWRGGSSARMCAGADGKPVAISIESRRRPTSTRAARGLFSTAPDYLAFTRMLLAGGTLDGVQVLKQETVKLMARNAIGDLDVPMVRSNNPALALEVETFPGQVKKWGLTFLINTQDVEGFRAAGSLTWGGVHNTYFWIDLKRAHHGRRHDADPAYRRSARARDHDRLRASTLCGKIERRESVN